MIIRFDATKEDADLIRKIAIRVHQLAWTPDLDDGWSRMGTEMDLTAVHLNICLLDLQALLEADDFNLVHDVLGIRNCLDRETGKLERGFWPRFARKEN